MDKYDEAIEWLRKQDAGQGTYYEEVAGLIEELLGRLWELEPRPPEPDRNFDKALHDAQQIGYGRQQDERARRWFASQRGSSDAIDVDE